MYFVDRKQIETKLDYMESCIELYQSTTSWDTKLNKLALERICHVVIEAIIDVGNAMIDGFIMRDPGSYEDIIDILEDENVIVETDAVMLKDIISVRKPLVQKYHHSEDHEFIEKLSKNLPAIKAFPEKVRMYLKDELGPVSAFLPSDSGEV